MTERGRENKPFQIKEAVCRCCLTLGCIPWKVDRNLRVGGEISPSPLTTDHASRHMRRFIEPQHMWLHPNSLEEWLYSL